MLRSPTGMAETRLSACPSFGSIGVSVERDPCESPDAKREAVRSLQPGGWGVSESGSG